MPQVNDFLGIAGTLASKYNMSEEDLKELITTHENEEGWQYEELMKRRQQVRNMKLQMETIGGMAGNPDAIDGCRLIVKRVRKILDHIEDEGFALDGIKKIVNNICTEMTGRIYDEHGSEPHEKVLSTQEVQPYIMELEEKIFEKLSQ